METALSLDGGAVPEVVFEGESPTIEAWGNAEGSSFGRLSVEVTAWPTSTPGRIDVRAVADPHALPGLGSASFEGRVDLPPLRAGEYTVHFGDQGAVHFLTVLSSRGWLHYRAFADPVLPDEMLLIQADGTAVAHREGEAGIVRLMLDRNAIREIRSWFDAAEFFELDDEYVGDDPAEVGRVELAYSEETRSHRVLAEKDRMPAALDMLVDQLSNLTSRVLASAPDLAPVTGHITIDPVQANPGTARTLRLVLVNEGEEAVTLSFPTGQQFDLELLLPPQDPGGPGSPNNDGNAGNDPNNPPNILLWNWSHGRTFEPTPSEIVLAPKDVETIEVSWNGHDNAGGLVGPGVYHIRGHLLGDNHVRIRAARLLVTGPVPNRVPLVGTLSVNPATASPATPREITLSITNLNDFAIDVTFNSTQQFDLAIVDPHRGGPPGPNNDPQTPGDSSVLWLWSEGMGFGDVVETITWDPGEVRTYTANWDGLDRANNPVGPGLYMLHAWVTGSERAAIRPVSVVVSN